MNADLTFLQEISIWQVCIAILTIVVMVKFLKALWPGLRNTIQFIDDVGKLSEFMDTTERKLEEVHHEVHYNNGTSIKDAVKRVENGVAGVYPELESLHGKVDEHIEHSVRWKARLSEIDERTQPGRPITERQENE